MLSFLHIMLMSKKIAGCRLIPFAVLMTSEEKFYIEGETF